MKKILQKIIIILGIIVIVFLNFGSLSVDSEIKAIGKTGNAESSFKSGVNITVQRSRDTVPWGVARIGALTVHGQNKGGGVKVAILDTGIDLYHPDIMVSGNVTFVSGTTDGDDDNGHGTLVAGIIAALDNGIGYVGVAPEVELYSVKVLNKSGKGALSSVLSGIKWAIENDMQVINMSFGDPSEMSQSVIIALEEANSVGIVIVTGAGNGGNIPGEGENVWAPARYESVIAVGAANKQDARYASSSTGDALELVAPGVKIYSTAMHGGYSYLSGTSAAAPHVSGVAALLIASGLDNNEDVRKWLQSSAIDLGETGWDPQFGHGLVNADSITSLIERMQPGEPAGVSVNGTLMENNWHVLDVKATSVGFDLSIFYGLSSKYLRTG